MRTLVVRTLLVATMLSLAPLAPSTAGAQPKPTLLRLEPEPSERPTAMMLATERCVALVKARELSAAADPCNSAVSAAQRERSSAWDAPFYARASEEHIAVAYNNRAVLRYLSGELALAAADATRATSAAELPGIGNTARVIVAARHRSAERD